MTIRVLVVDDQPLIRNGLVSLLSAASGYEPAGEAQDGAQAVELAARVLPDIVLIDIRMPVLDGISAIPQILAATGPHRPKVVVLTTYDTDEHVYDALAAGASGFLLKDTPPARILAALRVVLDGEVLLAPAITTRLVQAYARRRTWSGPTTRLARLTTRETEVLGLVAGGLSNGDIARHLVLSEETVKTHVKRLMSKLELSSRAQAVVVAYESGLAVPGQRP